MYSKIISTGVIILSFITISNRAVAQNSIPVTGVDADNEGVFAWNVAGSNVGHLIPAPYNNFGNDYAYYFFSSREVDNYDPAATTGMHGVGTMTGFSQFSAALALAGKSIGDINIRIGGPNLGNDTEGQDWKFTGAIESRYYRGGRYAILINNDTLLVGESGNSTLDINYNDSSTPFDDQMSGQSDYSIPEIKATDSSLIALATTFLNDIGQYGIRINFSSMQRAGQTEYNSGNVTGAFFEIQQATIESGSLLIPNLGSNLTACTGDSVMLDAGASRDSYLWSTGETTQIIYVKSTGNYFVTIDSAGTKGISAPATVTIDVCTGIKANKSKYIELFPNPANDFVNVHFNGIKVNRIEISTANGLSVKQLNLTNDGVKKISTVGLAPGMYLLQGFTAEGEVISKRLVIE
ncbi:MAG: hypothetical protein ACJAZ2_000149 [Glaciecola sp.]|jgi:hypothetical protein